MTWKPDWPFAPKRFPFFYGWAVLALAIVGVLMSIPGQTIGVSVFTEPLLETTGLGRVALTTAYMIGTTMSGVMLPFGGRLLDRIGPRRTAAIASVGLGVTLFVLAGIDELLGGANRLLSTSRSPVVAGAILTVAFAALRFSGQGMLTLSSRTMFVTWFSKRRGFASGIFSVFITLGFSYSPVLLNSVIGRAGGWREAWVALGFTAAVGMTAVALLLFRDTPESCGLLPDGADPAETEQTESLHAPGDVARPHSRAEAMRTGAFWSVVLGLATQSAVITGVTFHIIDIGAEAGLTGEEAIGLFPPIAVVSVVVGFVSGAASDRMRLRPLVAALLIAQVTGFVGFARLASDLGWAMAVVGIGSASGLFGSISSMGLAKLFGRKHIGSLLSAQMSALVIASALGPSLLALSRDGVGSYSPALYLVALIPVLILGSVAIARDPQPTGDRW